MVHRWSVGTYMYMVPDQAERHELQNNMQMLKCYIESQPPPELITSEDGCQLSGGCLIQCLATQSMDSSSSEDDDWSGEAILASITMIDLI